MDTNGNILAQTIRQFCVSHNVSPSGYYVLKKRGLNPVEIRLGRKILISAEASKDWRARMEALSQATPPATK